MCLLIFKTIAAFFYLITFLSFFPLNLTKIFLFVNLSEPASSLSCFFSKLFKKQAHNIPTIQK